MIYTDIEIYNAQNYMNEYRILLEDYNLHVGWLGRIFNKLFGMNMHKNIQSYLKHEYNLDYIHAADILYNTDNKEYIFDPLNIFTDKKNKNKLSHEKFY